MQLINETGFPAHILKAEIHDGGHMLATVLVKVTYDLADDGTLTPSSEPMPLCPEPVPTAFGTFHGEHFVAREGVDLCVLGSFVSDTPVTRAFVVLRVGESRHMLRLTGERVWEPDPVTGELTPSAPRPFTRMPVAWTHAFGGQTEVGGELYAHPDNPEGRGFYLDAGAARGQPLPCIEPGEGPFQSRWDEPVPVAGWGPYAMFGGLRAREGLVIDEAKMELVDVRRRIFNNAHPDLVFTSLDARAPVVIEGMRPWRVTVPVPADRLAVDVQWGPHRHEVAGGLDGLYVFLDAARVVATHRATFHYQFVPQEVRRAVARLARD